MKQLWLSLMAAAIAVAPVTLARSQDSGAATQQPADDDDDDASAGGAPAPMAGGTEAPADDDGGEAEAGGGGDDDDDDEGGSAMVPTGEELTIPPGSEMMPASALNGDQIGLPETTLSTQIVTPLVLGSAEGEFNVSHKDIYLRAGQAYRWNIGSEGTLEYKWHAPGFFRNVWMNQLVISDLEVHMAGAPAWLEYDAQGVISMQFQTIRPGRYEWYVEGLDEEQGMRGTITIVP